MPIYDKNKILNQFFKPVGQEILSNPNPTVFNNNGVKKGSLISFNYIFWKNDAYPLVIVSDNTLTNGKLWGVNVHYLTFPYIKKLLKLSQNNPSFSYTSISSDAYMKKAFRSYKRQGIRQLKVLNHDSLLNIMSMVRSYDPAEVQIIRKQVREQINKQINPKASEITNLNDDEETSVGGE